ncbi:MAG: PAS domain S-box protein [Nitrospira sp.]|nr:PAS domain S-box protein [Nitrospira sp.]
MAGKTPKRRRVVRRVRGELRPQGVKGAEARAQGAQQVLLAITRTQALFIDGAQPARLFGALLEELLTLTNSAYGLIGEVERIAEGQPFLRIHAMTDIAWNEDTKALMAQKATTLELNDLKTLFGHAMTTGKPVIVNDPAHDPRAGGLPPGYPPMHALLGLPFYHKEMLIGMAGIANRPGGYDESLITFLEPFLSTCAQLLDGSRHRRLRAEAEAELHSSEDRWQLAMQGSDDGIWDWDLVDNQVYFSPRWKEMLGYGEHEISGDYQEWESRLHPEDREYVISQLTDYLERRSLRYQVECRLRKKNGEYCWVHARGKATWDAGGRPYRMTGCHTEITDRKLEEALQTAEKQALELVVKQKLLERASQDQTDRLRLAMDIARLATWDWNILTNQIIWSDNYEEVKGLPRGSFDGTFEAYQRLVHPEDLPKLLADIEGALSGQQPYHTEHRIVPPTGEVQWVEGNGVVYRDELGRPIRMVGTVRNITERKRIEQAMRVNEERYVRATAVGRVGVWELDVRAGTYYGDKNLKAMFGYQPDELSADPLAWLNLVHPGDQAIAMDHWQRIVRREAEDYNYELRMTKKDGTIIWTDVRGHAIRHVDGQVTHLIGATFDITARRQAEDNLLRTQFAMDHAVDAVYWINPQAGILYTNAAASAMLGYTKEEFLRMTVHDLNPDFPAEVWPGWWEEMREKKVMSLESVHLTKNGRRIPIDIRVSFLAYGGQEFHCAYVRDISERKRVDEALRASQERFELAAIASNDGIWDWNILTGDQYWSDRHLELFGLERSAFIPTYDAWIALVHPDDADWVHRTTQRHLDTREPYDIEVRVKIQDGSYRWFRDRGQAVWDSTGRPVRMVGSISDVTERRNSEEAIWNAHAELEQRVMERTKQLAASNHALEDEMIQRKRVEDRLQRTQYAVDHAADQIFVMSSNGYFLDVNESACRRLGYTKEELLTMSVMDIDPDFPSTRWDEMWDTLRSADQLLIETRHRSKTGEIYPVEVVANYLEHNGQELDYAIVRDLTERRRSEAAIRESELRYKLVTEATFDAIALHDNGVLIEVNAGLERMFGYQSGELLGRSILDLIADESRDEVLRNMRDGMTGPYEALGRRKDGTTFAGEVVVRPYCFRGKQVRLVAGRDITARKQLETALARHTEELERQVSERTAEVARLESQRAQSEKLAAVGQLAAAVAHEINNPIAGIRNAFTLVKQAVDQAHPHHEFVGMIDREISRVADIVRNMYQLYRKQPSKTEPVDLRLLLDDLNALFAKQLSQGDMTFVATLQCSMTTLQVPRGDLLQVLMNLIQNAIDSSGPGRTITLTVCEKEGTVNIIVSDEGGGIAPDVLPHIFDPFFTTKTEKYQKGMGLGLSVSQSLVMAMGGRIEVRTELKTGSTFSVVLPQTTPVDRSTAQQYHIIKEVVTHDY